MRQNIVTVFLVAMVTMCSGHGRLHDPPGRSSMWRHGFNTTMNFNDNELFCGGFGVQYFQNGGKCGVCGDSYSDRQPRDNEAGGVYGQGVITRSYRQGQIIRVHVELTARHLGWMTFKLCPTNDPKYLATQECLDEFVLERADNSGTKTFVDNTVRQFYMAYRLPENLSCVQCVLQWRYHTGNSEGCEGDTCCLGCGNQEEFYGCSDIQIRPQGPHRPFYPKEPFALRRRR